MGKFKVKMMSYLLLIGLKSLILAGVNSIRRKPYPKIGQRK